MKFGQTRLAGATALAVAGLGLAGCGGDGGIDDDSGNAAQPDQLPAVAYFAASDGVDGVELWKSDGTQAGTMQVADINPAGDADPENFVRRDEIVAFTATDGTGREVWRSTGDDAEMLLDVNASGGSEPVFLRASEGRLYFQANDGSIGAEPYVSDGTPAGTGLLKDIQDDNSGGDFADSSFARVMGSVGGLTLLAADDGESGFEPWITDGTTAGTELLIDINGGGGDSLTVTDSTAVLDGELYFEAETGASGVELWKTDGTEAGTTMVAEVVPGVDGIGNDNSGGREIVAAGGLVFFEVENGANPGLWVTDGTEAGTAFVSSVSMNNPLAFNGQLYFSGFDGEQSELWTSDGTAAGTVMVKDINPGPERSRPGGEAGFAEFGGELYFDANSGDFNPELWKTDGTEAGTVQVAEINPGTNPALPGNFRVIEAGLLFSATDGASGCELWISDGTEAGTRQVADINAGADDGFPGECSD